MLLRFGVANFRSIRDYQELLLTASTRISRKRPAMPVPTVRKDAVPIAAVYGANASGKSNLIAAMRKMQQHIVMSHKSRDATDPISREHFRLDDVSFRQPTRMDCTFVIKNSEADNGGEVYEYGFEFTATEYSKEWLLCTVRGQRQTTRTLFERETVDGEVNVRFGGQLQGQNKTVASLTRSNSLYLSAAAQNNHPQLSKIHHHIAKRWAVLSGKAISNDFEIAERLDGYPHMEQLMRAIRQADLGIVGTDVLEFEPDEKQLDFFEKTTKAMAEFLNEAFSQEASLEDTLKNEFKRVFKKFQFTHSGVDNVPRAFGYDLESEGTRTLTSLLIPALEVLSSGSLLVVDELDSSLHPRLVRAFVSLFKGESNLKGAQLICSTHDTSLLSDGLLELDEVWMAEKARNGASSFTPLTDYRLRSRDDLERAYRDGRVGGVPTGRDLVVDLG